jgi:hypothetical protein
MAKCILDQMEKLNQKITITRPIPQEFPNIYQRLIIQLTALGRHTPLAPTRLPNAFAFF